MSPASDQSARESPVPNCLDQPTVLSSDAEQTSPPAHPEIVVHEVEDNEKSFGSTEKTPEPKSLEKAQESPLSCQHSPDPLSPRHPQSPLKGSFIPSTIAYKLRFLIKSKECPNSSLDKEFSVLLHKPESYQEIERVADDHANTLSAENISSRVLTFFYGNCTIVSDDRTKFRLPLRSSEDWKEVDRQIVTYWKDHSRERLRLHISRHYLASPELSTEADCFAEAKSLEIDDLMTPAWEKQSYIPHNILETVISDQTIDRIIEEGPPRQHDQYAFTRRVQSEARILFALCLHAGLNMDCLLKLLDSGSKDSSLPLDKSSQCHDKCRKKFKSLLEKQGGFQAARFVEGEHKELHQVAVVPLHFYPKAYAQDDLDHELMGTYGDEPQNLHGVGSASKKDAQCGSGAHSTVYCVKINPNHHSVSKDLDACFALKVLRDINQDLFDRELNMLKELRRLSHSHIVTHLASWTQEGEYYILFPYAQCNLREYMSQNTFAKSDDIWLLGQFRGMAEAVKRIHALSDEETTTLNLTVKTSAPGDRKTAWHHDIKPENILFFKDNTSDYGMFRLSDWGSAKVNPYRTRSINTTSPIGTLTYEPPERTKEGKTSRPYDIWSLGCVFLELLVWAVSGSRFVTIFGDQRDGKRKTNARTDSDMDDGFWQESENEFKLRPSVITQLQDLDEKLGKPGALPFKEVVGHIRQMLETEADKRIKAGKVCSLLEETIRTTKSEVKSPSDGSKPGTQLSPIPTDQQSPNMTAQEISPTGQTSSPKFAEHINLSPSDMSPRASRHSRNSSASEFMASHATHSRQSSNASNHSTLSVRERKDSHSSASSSRANEGST